MRRLHVGLALLLTACAPTASVHAQSALSNCKYYTKTQQDFQSGLPYCEQCIKDEPDNPEARYYGAWCLAEMGRYADAWPSFAWLMERSNEKDKSVQKHAKWATERVQAYFARHFNDGVKQLKANNLVAARDEFEKATQISPNKVDGFLNLGYVQNQLDQQEAAVASFRKAIEIAPDRPDAYEYFSVALGRKRSTLLAAQPQDSAAVAQVTAELRVALEKVVQNDPSKDVALLELADLEMASGNQDRAVEHITKAMEISPDNVVKLYNIAVNQYQRKDYSGAAKTFSLVADKINDPTDDLWRDAQYNRALALKEMGDFQAAATCVEALIAAKEDEADYHTLASGIYVKLNDLKKANTHFERAEALKAKAVEDKPAEGKPGGTP